MVNHHTVSPVKSRLGRGAWAHPQAGALIAGLVASDVYMIVTGLVAGWTDDPALKWWFYGLSCLSFIAI